MSCGCDDLGLLLIEFVPQFVVLLLQGLPDLIELLLLQLLLLIGRHLEEVSEDGLVPLLVVSCGRQAIVVVVVPLVERLVLLSPVGANHSTGLFAVEVLHCAGQSVQLHQSLTCLIMSLTYLHGVGEENLDVSSLRLWTLLFKHL